jgi:AcrR family transcriptional regulator
MVAAANGSGYEEATIAEVIAHAGVSRPTFYDYFADRQACFDAALVDAQMQLTEDVRRAVQHGEPEGAADRAVEAIVAFAASESGRARFLMKEALAAGARVLDTRDRGIAEIAQMIEREFAQVTPRRAIPDLPMEVAIGATHRLLATRLRRGERSLSDTLEDLLAWLSNYERPAGEHRWRTVTRTSGVAASPFVAPTSLRTPLPLPRGRPRISAAAVAENHRQRIMLATSRIVTERGYTEATIADITSAAGVSGRAFSRLFANKEDAFSAIYEHGFQDLMATVAGAYFAGSSWPERVWEGMRAAMQSVQLNSAAGFAFVEAYAVGPAAIQRVEESRMAFTIFMREGYRYDARESDPARFALEAAVTSVFELIYRQARVGASANSGGLTPHGAYLCLAPFLGPERATDFIAEKLGAARGGIQGRASKATRETRQNAATRQHEDRTINT